MLFDLLKLFRVDVVVSGLSKDGPAGGWANPSRVPCRFFGIAPLGPWGGALGPGPLGWRPGPLGSPSALRPIGVLEAPWDPLGRIPFMGSLGTTTGILWRNLIFVIRGTFYCPQRAL